MLQLKEITKHYGSIKALYPTSLTIPSGVTKVLLGPSGSGKSTLLRIMIGLTEPDGGTVLFNGKPITEESRLLVRRKMGYVIQDGGLFPHLTVRNNSSLLAKYLGWGKNRIDERLKQMIELTHLPMDSLDRFPLELSGGQRQRVSLMRALMLDPDVLLLDEPLGALDPMIRADLQEDLREIFQTLGKTVIMVTHDIGEAGFFANEIVLMREGIVVQEGSLETLVKNPSEKFVQQFINAQRSPLEEISL
jgi:osmoprotectant transport system ATP-binding protein